MTLKVILAMLQLGFTIWVSWARGEAEENQKAIDLKKEVSDAVKSGDVQRVNLLIQRINRV